MTFTARELSREQLSDDRAGRSGVSTDIADGFPEVRHPAVHVEARIWFRADEAMRQRRERRVPSGIAVAPTAAS